MPPCLVDFTFLKIVCVCVCTPTHTPHKRITLLDTCQSYEILSSVPINKVLLESSHPHLFMFSHDTSRVEHLQQRPYGSPSVYLLYGPFQKQFVQASTILQPNCALKYVPVTGLVLWLLFLLLSVCVCEIKGTLSLYFCLLLNNYCLKSLHRDS